VKGKRGKRGREKGHLLVALLRAKKRGDAVAFTLSEGEGEKKKKNWRDAAFCVALGEEQRKRGGGGWR